MSDAYGFLAPIYQPISRLVFGKDLFYANQAFLEDCEEKKILILGGGDGIAYRHFGENIRGEYWDSSPNMAEIARKNLHASGLKVNAGTWPGTGNFDQILLPFILDTLSDIEIKNLLSQVKSALSHQGHVTISDFFEPVSFGQKLIQKTMIGFFRTFAAHQRKDLPAITQIFESQGFELIEEKIWRNGWIRAQLWKPL